MGQAKSSKMNKTNEKAAPPPSAMYSASAPPLQPGFQQQPPQAQKYGAPPPAYSMAGGPPPGGAEGPADAPPAYSATPHNSLVGFTGCPQQQQFQQQYMAQHQMLMAQVPQGPVQAQFDAGARFSAHAPPSIPPPPPGVTPTQSQMAAMQGRQVVMGQKEGGILKGSGGAGYTFW